MCAWRNPFREGITNGNNKMHVHNTSVAMAAPPRAFEKYCIPLILLIVAISAALPVRAQQVSPPVCERTAAMRDALEAATGIACARITSADLAGLTGTLDLELLNIGQLQEGDLNGLTSLTELKLNDNNLTGLPAGIFGELASLTWLHLPNNNLAVLPADVFDPLTSLTRLDLDVNELNNLPAGIFDKLTALERLDLDHNGFADLPAGVFDKLTALERLDLDHNGFAALPAGIFDNLSSLDQLRLGDNDLAELPANVFDHLTSLTRLYMPQNKLASLPAGVFDELTLLRELVIDGNQLTELPAGIFDRLVALEDLHLRGNSLTSIAQDLLVATNLSLAEDNGSATIPSMPQNLRVINGGSGILDAFWNLPARSRFDITGYKLRWREAAGAAQFAAENTVTVGAEARSHAIGGLTDGAEYEVQVAALSDRIDHHAEHLIFFATTHIAGNYAAATGTPAKTAPFMPQNLAVTPDDRRLHMTWDAPLRDGGDAVLSYTLRWKSAAVTTFSLNDGATLTAATTAYTIGGLANGATYAAEVAAINAQGVGEFSAAHGSPLSVPVCGRTPIVRDKIVSIIGGGKTCSQITAGDLARVTDTLVFDFEGITELRAGDFSGFIALTSLNLEGNRLTALHAGMFDELTSLTELNINENDLTILPANIFDQLTSLTKLELNSNDLIVLPAGVFDRLPLLTELGLGGNDLVELAPGVFDPLTSLVELKLHRNEFITASLPAGVFDQLTSLQTLTLHDNNLTTLPVDLLAKLTSLTTLELYERIIMSIPQDALVNTNLSHGEDESITIPGAPQNLSGTVTGDGRLNVQWQPPVRSRFGIVNYKVRWREIGAGFSGENTAIVGATARSHAITASTAAAGYEVQIAALSNQVNDAKSFASILAATPIAGNYATIAAPEMPQNVTVAAVGNLHLGVNWDAPAHDGGAPILSYMLRWKSAADETFTSANIAADTTYTISGINSGTTYDVQVAAINVLGAGEYSAAVQGIPADNPATPANLRVHPANEFLSVSWDFLSGGITYVVQWRSDATANFNETREITATNYTIGGLTNGSTYEVQVAAVNAADENDIAESAFTEIARSRPIHFSMDVDRAINTAGAAANLRDHILIARMLFGVSGAKLTDGLSDTTHDIVTANINPGAVAGGALDVDANGETDWRDGVMLMRYALGFRGAALIADVSAAAGKLTDTRISVLERHIAALQ